MSGKNIVLKQTCKRGDDVAAGRACGQALEVLDGLPETEVDARLRLESALYQKVAEGKLEVARPGVFRPTGGGAERRSR